MITRQEIAQAALERMAGLSAREAEEVIRASRQESQADGGAALRRWYCEVEYCPCWDEQLLEMVLEAPMPSGFALGSNQSVPRHLMESAVAEGLRLHQVYGASLREAEVGGEGDFGWVPEAVEAVSMETVREEQIGERAEQLLAAAFLWSEEHAPFEVDWHGPQFREIVCEFARWETMSSEYVLEFVLGHEEVAREALEPVDLAPIMADLEDLEGWDRGELRERAIRFVSRLGRESSSESNGRTR